MSCAAPCEAASVTRGPAWLKLAATAQRKLAATLCAQPPPGPPSLGCAAHPGRSPGAKSIGARAMLSTHLFVSFCSVLPNRLDLLWSHSCRCRQHVNMYKSSQCYVQVHLPPQSRSIQAEYWPHPCSSMTATCQCKPFQIIAALFAGCASGGSAVAGGVPARMTACARGPRMSCNTAICNGYFLLHMWRRIAISIKPPHASRPPPNIRFW